MFINTDHEEK